MFNYINLCNVFNLIRFIKTITKYIGTHLTILLREGRVAPPPWIFFLFRGLDYNLMTDYTFLQTKIYREVQKVLIRIHCLRRKWSKIRIQTISLFMIRLKSNYAKQKLLTPVKNLKKNKKKRKKISSNVNFLFVNCYFIGYF